STAPTVATGGMTTFTSPAISPAYLGVGYIIGPRLAALNFAGGVVAWGLLVPLLIYFLGPNLPMPAGSNAMGYWGGVAGAVWFSIVRPIAVGGMLVGAGYTLFKMRKQLGAGMARAISDLKKSAAAHEVTDRTERDLNDKIAFAGVSGNLVGLIGSSNNPVSGLTLCTLVVAALLMVALGVSGTGGVAAVLGVAAVVCVSSAVAGEMLQDLKVGHILGGTPSKMQIGDMFGI